MKPQFPQKKMSLSELYQSEIINDQAEQKEQVNSNLKFKFDPNFSDRKEKLMSSQFVNPNAPQLNKSSIIEEYQMELKKENPLNQRVINMTSGQFSSSIFKQPFNQQIQQNQLSFLNASSFKSTPMNLPLIGSRIISPIGGKRQSSDVLRLSQQFQQIHCSDNVEDEFQLSLFYYSPQIGITYVMKDDIFITIIDQSDIKKIRLILNDYDIQAISVFYSQNLPQQIQANLKQIIQSIIKIANYSEIVSYDIQESLQIAGFRNPEIYDESLIDKQTYINLCSALPVLTRKNLDTILNLLTENETRCKLKFNDELQIQLGLIKQENKPSIQQIFEKFFSTLQGKKIFNYNLRNPISSQQILLKRFNYLSCFDQFARLPSYQRLMKMPQKIGSFSLVLKSLATYQERSEPYQKLFMSLNFLVEFIQEVKKLIMLDRLSQQKTCQLLKDLCNFDLEKINQLIDFIESSLVFSNSKDIIIKGEKYPQYQKLLLLEAKFQLRRKFIIDRHLSELIIQGIKPDIIDIQYIDDCYYLVITSHFDITDKLGGQDWCHIEEKDENNRTYYQTQFTQELDQLFGNIHFKISSMKESIIIFTVQEILQHQEFLEKIEEVIGEIDYYIGLSLAIIQLRLCIPKLNNKNQINISGGRHLLVEETKGHNIQFQPNDFFLNDKRIFVIVGPNFSGKSVFIRQIGLIIYLAHCGLPVPAKNADIYTLEEIQAAFPCEGKPNSHLSLMDQQLLQIKSILQVSSRSLVLMDEIGKNFKYQIGSNLHKSALEFFSLMKPHPPIVLSATHYQNHESLLDLKTISQGEMEVVLESSKNLIFIYRINFSTQRSSKKSFGLEVALMVHQNEVLYQRGLKIYELLTKNQYLSKSN